MLTEDFPNLTQLYGQGPLSGYMGGVQTDNARRSQQINQQTALQDLYQKEQMLPIDMGMKQAQTRNYDASTANMGETTRGNRFKNDMNDYLKSDMYQAEKAKLKASMSKDEIDDAKNQITQMMLSGDPKVMHVAQQLRTMFDDIFPDLIRGDQMGQRQLAIEEARGANQATTANIRANAVGKRGDKPLTMSQWEAEQREKARQGDPDALEAVAMLEEDRRQRNPQAAAVAPLIKQGMPEVPDNSSTGKVKPQAQAQQYEKGKQYKGQTGTYEYLGGPVEDKASWKKVN